MRLFLVMCAAVAVWAAPAEACSCAPRTDEEALEKAAVVVEGKVSLASAETSRGSVTVTRALKGAKVGEVIDFHWKTSSPFMCPTVKLKVGAWRLYLMKTEQGLSLTTCDFNSRPLQ